MNRNDALSDFMGRSEKVAGNPFKVRHICGDGDSLNGEIIGCSLDRDGKGP
jgi:hypothetical protein